jgi:hypothetical protein
MIYYEKNYLIILFNFFFLDKSETKEKRGCGFKYSQQKSLVNKTLNQL